MKNLMIASVAVFAFTFISANSVKAGGGHHCDGHHCGGHHGGGHHGGGHGGFFLPWHFGYNAPQSIMPQMDNWDTDCIPRSNKVKFGLEKYPLSTIS